MSAPTPPPRKKPGPPIWAKPLNFLGFQAGWLACVWGGAQGMPWLGPLVAVPLLALHGWLSPQPRRELGFVALAGGAGWLLDQALAGAGLFRFLHPWPAGLPCPLWMLALWMLFASTLNSSLGWLRGRPVLAALLGAVGGPLAYAAGARLGAIALPSPPWISLAWLAAAWAVLTPGLSWWGRRWLNGGQSSP